MNKRFYRDRDTAYQGGLRSLAYTSELWVYKCPLCTGWHLTSKKYKDQDRVLPITTTVTHESPMPTHPEYPDLTPIKSSMMDGYSYDPTTREMHIRFKNDGSVWRYSDVPIDKAEAFGGAASKGAFFVDRIRGNHMAQKL